MSTDTSGRELLELAARAAFDIHPDLLKSKEWWDGFLSQWNPLEDDAHALRLANKLGLELLHYPLYEEAKHTVIVRKRRWNPDGGFDTEVILEVEPYGSDLEAATRRAIVRAAAEIGRQMP